MTTEEALNFVAVHGVVLEAARGPVPNLVEAIVGEPIAGSWWGHPLGRTIYSIINAVRDDPTVLVCRLVDRRITYVHERLWPALARLAMELDNFRIAAIQEKHAFGGRHQVIETPFLESMPATVADRAHKLSREEAIKQLGPWVVSLLGAPVEPHGSRRTR